MNNFGGISLDPASTKFFLEFLFQFSKNTPMDMKQNLTPLWETLVLPSAKNPDLNAQIFPIVDFLVKKRSIKSDEILSPSDTINKPVEPIDEMVLSTAVIIFNGQISFSHRSFFFSLLDRLFY
jgi:hypothetical protein